MRESRAAVFPVFLFLCASAAGQTLTLSNHGGGQESDAFPNSGSQTDAELFAFRLTPSTGTITVTQLVFTLSNLSGLVNGDWSGVELIVDANGDGAISAGETTAVGGSATVNQGAGSATFSSSFNVSAATDYILRADFASLSGGDAVTLNLTAGNITSAATEAGSASSATHTEADASSGLVLYHRLNEGSGTTATDSSGNSDHGTVVNATWTTGVYGNALNLDGTGDYVDLTTSVATSSVGSASLWFRTTTNFNQDALLYYGSDSGTGNGNGSESELHINFTSSETLRFFIEGGASDVSITSTGTYADGAWHNVIATWDISGSAALYVDGTSVGTATHDANNFTFSSRHRLGRPGADARYFTGRLDEFRLFNRMLNAEEIALLARDAGFVAHWTFDDGTGTTAADVAGGVNGTLTNMEAGDWEAGNICTGLHFDGTDEYISVAANSLLNLTTNYTITGWFKLDVAFNSSSADTQLLISKYLSDSNNMHVALIGTDYGNTTASDGAIAFKVERADNARLHWTATTSWSAGTWYHFALANDASNGANNKIYIDGADLTSGTTLLQGTGSADLNYSAAFQIAGKDGDSLQVVGAEYFDGMMDDVRLYNRILSAAEIQALAATYQVVDLGALSEDYSLAMKINGAEQTVGFDEDEATGDPSAWISQYGAFTSLGTLPGGSVAEAHGINTAGKVVGWSENASGYRRGFIWTSGAGMTALGVLNGKSDSEAFAINASDQVVGTSLNFSPLPTDRTAFLYLPSDAYGLSAGMNNLGTLGGTHSIATDLNDAGQVVGGAQNVSQTMRPFLWLPSAAYGLSAGMNDLGTLGGDINNPLHRAEAINGSGEVVGMSYTAGNAARAFLWLPSAAYGLSAGMNNLGVLPGGNTSWALDVNGSGVVVGTSNVTGGAYHAFIWKNGTMTDLNDLLDADVGWVLTRATGINADGEIAGWGTNKRGQVRGYVLTQTCSATAMPGQTAGFSEPLASAQAVIGPRGTIDEPIILGESEPIAAVRVLQGPPAAQLVVSAIVPAGAADRIGPGGHTALGFENGMWLEVMLTVEAEAIGEAAYEVSITGGLGEIEDIGAGVADFQIHLIDLSDARRGGAWLPAGRNLGNVEPTGMVGDSGYVVNTDGTVNYWAVVSAPGLFAVGRTAHKTADPPPPPDGATGDPGAEAPVRSSGLCGSGVVESSTLMFVGLAIIRRHKNRRF